ncbi:MAG: helix-turn-helix domain-containing protein [Solirubrobacteraceae bacterium]
MATRGRPPNPIDPDASHSARLGAELAHRLAEGLTLQALGDLIGFTPQHVSEVERAKTAPTRPFIAACDHALNAHGALLELLPAAVHERDTQRHERAAARRGDRDPSLRCEAHSDAGDEDVDPTNRRGLLGAGAGAAAALGLSGVAAPTQARQIDPDLPAHWTALLNLLDRHDAMFGPHDVLASVLRELHVIAEHRQIALGELRAELMRVEARWAEFAAFLSNDAGQRAPSRTAWVDRAARLAQEAGDPDTLALARMRQCQWAMQELDGRRAVAYAEEALGVSGMSEQTRARCALRAAHGHALAGDAVACERHLADAYAALWSGPAPAVPPGAVTPSLVRVSEARCFAWMQQPRKAIPLYEAALREWPRDQMRDGGLHQAGLARACAAVGERDRARAEGRKALAIARTTKSSVITRELKRLGAELRAA